MEKVMNEIYQKIAYKINEIIPESWDKVYLYTEIDDGYIRLYFYYYSEAMEKSICNLNIVEFFEIDEDYIDDLEYELEEYFEELWELFKENNQEPWTHLTFILENTGNFSIEYGYEDLSESNSYKQHIIWMYKYLGLKKEGEWEEEIIEEYKQKLKESISD